MRMWLGLGAGALAVLLCCGGGSVAMFGLAITSGQATEEQARAVTEDYYQAVADEQYGRAYELLCDNLQHRESQQEFQQRLGAEPAIATYKVGEPDVNDLTVPVDVTFDGGGKDRQQVTLSEDRNSGSLEICGVS